MRRTHDPVPSPEGSDFLAPGGLYRSATGLSDGPTVRLSPPDDPPAAEPTAAQPSAAAPPRRHRHRWVGTLAVLALLAAAGAGAVSWRALERAGAAYRLASGDPAAAPPSTADSGPAPAQSAGPEDGPVSGSDDDVPAGPLAPSASFSVAEQGTPLRLQLGCSAVLAIDLDAVRIDADDQHGDLRYDSRCGSVTPTLAPGPGAEAAARADGRTRTAQDCDRRLRDEPLDRDAGVPVRAGLRLCVLTSAADAEERGAEQRLVLLTVASVTDGGAAALDVTSWSVRS